MYGRGVIGPVTRLVAFVVAVVSAGCIYEQPLVPGRPETVDRRLLGQWRCVSPDNAEPAILRVTESPDRKYLSEFGGGDAKPSVFSAYAVNFQGKILLNAQEIEDGEARKWTLARYSLYRPTVLHLEFARDEPFRDATTTDQRVAILRRELKDSGLFEDYCTCIRLKNQE